MLELGLVGTRPRIISRTGPEPIFLHTGPYLDELKNRFLVNFRKIFLRLPVNLSVGQKLGLYIATTDKDLQ